MSLIIGRISYLPDSPISLRKFRWENQSKMYKELMTLKPEGVNIIKVAQNYKNLKSHDSEVFEMIKHYDKLGICKARNLLLKSFYRSDYDYMVLLDDDCAFYDYYHVKDLLQELHDNPSRFTDIHCITALEPQYVPFKKDNEKLECDKYYVFQQHSMSQGSGCFILINFRKYFNKEYYFDETIKTGLDADAEHELLDFYIRLMKDGYKVLDCRNLIQKNYANNTGQSTIFQGSDNISDACKRVVANTAAKYDIPIENGKVRFSKGLNYFDGYIKINIDKGE